MNNRKKPKLVKHGHVKEEVKVEDEMFSEYFCHSHSSSSSDDRDRDCLHDENQGIDCDHVSEYHKTLSQFLKYDADSHLKHNHF